MTLGERARELEQKRGELAALFEGSETAGGEYDLSPEQCQEVQRRNAELAELQAAYAGAKGEAKAAQEAAAANERELAGLREVKRPEFGAGGRGQAGARAASKSLGELFVESAAFRECRGGVGPVASVPDFDLKTLFQTTAGWAPQTTRTGFLLLSPQERIRVVDLIPKTETVQAAVKYMEETTLTNNAAEASEAATYGEAVLALTEKTSTVRKIAVSLPVTDEQFDDEPHARDYVNNRLDYMLRARLDKQILVGDGNAPNLLGGLNVSGINTQAKGTDPGADAIYKGIVKVRINGFTEPSGIVMHPTDWQNLRLLRSADGVYIWGNPAETGMETIWGLPVVQTTFETLGTAFLGDWAQFSELSLRRGIEFQVTNAHSTFFVEGKQMIRADFRCALIFYRPKAFCTVTGL